VQGHAAGSLAEIEKATLRLVTLRTAGNLSDAAARLGMAPVSLDKWLRHRRSPLLIPSGGRSHR
jgi:DNA-binding protein Fis